MITHLRCIGEEYWEFTKKYYNPPVDLSHATTNEKIEFGYKMRAKESLLSVLSDVKYTNVMELETAHEVWMKIEALHERYPFVKEAKLLSLKGKLDALKMSEDEKIKACV